MLDINSFSEQISSSSNFGTKTATIYSGSRIVKEDDYWSIVVDDSSVPIPIALKLAIITDAFQKGLWTTTPDKGTYKSLKVSKKLKNLKKALAEYPSVSGAQINSGET